MTRYWTTLVLMMSGLVLATLVAGWSLAIYDVAHVSDGGPVVGESPAPEAVALAHGVAGVNGLVWVGLAGWAVARQLPDDRRLAIVAVRVLMGLVVLGCGLLTVLTLFGPAVDDGAANLTGWRLLGGVTTVTFLTLVPLVTRWGAQRQARRRAR